MTGRSRDLPFSVTILKKKRDSFKQLRCIKTEINNYYYYYYLLGTPVGLFATFQVVFWLYR